MLVGNKKDPEHKRAVRFVSLFLFICLSSTLYNCTVIKRANCLSKRMDSCSWKHQRRQVESWIYSLWIVSIICLGILIAWSHVFTSTLQVMTVQVLAQIKSGVFDLCVFVLWCVCWCGFAFEPVPVVGGHQGPFELFMSGVTDIDWLFGWKLTAVVGCCGTVSASSVYIRCRQLQRW